MPKPPDLGPLSPDERQLLRLFRCLDGTDRPHVLYDVAERVMEGLPEKPWPEEVETDGDYDEDVPDRLENPAFVRWLLKESGWWDNDDLQNLDNTGTWISVAEAAWGDNLPWVALAGSGDDSRWAACLREEYVEYAQTRDIPLMSECGATEDEMNHVLEESFRCFLAVWRELMLRMLESLSAKR